jgi:hypothetical protein
VKVNDIAILIVAIARLVVAISRLTIAITIAIALID